MRSVKLLVAMAAFAAFIAGPVLAQDAAPATSETAPSTTAPTAKKHTGKHHTGKHHHKKAATTTTTPAQ